MAITSPTPLKSFHLCDLIFDKKPIEALPKIGINEKIYPKRTPAKETTFIVRENNGELFAFKVNHSDVYKASLVKPETIFCMAESEEKIRAFMPWFDRRKINFIN